MDDSTAYAWLQWLALLVLFVPSKAQFQFWGRRGTSTYYSKNELLASNPLLLLRWAWPGLNANRLKVEKIVL